MRDAAIILMKAAKILIENEPEDALQAEQILRNTLTDEQWATLGEMSLLDVLSTIKLNQITSLCKSRK